jgi:hypothetical protein
MFNLPKAGGNSVAKFPRNFAAMVIWRLHINISAYLAVCLQCTIGTNPFVMQHHQKKYLLSHTKKAAAAAMPWLLSVLVQSAGTTMYQ